MKKTDLKKARRLIQANHIIAVDESSFISGWNTRNGWYEVGKPVTTPISLPRKRYHAFGGLYGGGFTWRTYEKSNSRNFYDFLKYLHKKHGQIIVILDNAIYHKTKMIRNLVEASNGDIIPLYLPPYTPELNPCEHQWDLLKKSFSNTLHSSVEDMRLSMRSMLRKGEVKVAKLSGYLL